MKFASLGKQTAHAVIRRPELPGHNRFNFEESSCYDVRRNGRLAPQNLEAGGCRNRLFYPVSIQSSNRFYELACILARGKRPAAVGKSFGDGSRSTPLRLTPSVAKFPQTTDFSGCRHPIVRFAAAAKCAVQLEIWLFEGAVKRHPARTWMPSATIFDRFFRRNLIQTPVADQRRFGQ